jgi:hypothetical protein
MLNAPCRSSSMCTSLAPVLSAPEDYPHLARHGDFREWRRLLCNPFAPAVPDTARNQATASQELIFYLIDFITLHMLILHRAPQTEPFDRNQKAARRVGATASQLALWL